MFAELSDTTPLVYLFFVFVFFFQERTRQAGVMEEKEENVITCCIYIVLILQGQFLMTRGSFKGYRIHT